VREIASAHRRFVDTIWARLLPEKADPLSGEKETISVERAAEFWPVLTLSIDVPYWRWTAEHYHNRMEHAYEVMRGRSSEGEHFDEEPLSVRQANAVIRVFSRWMDEHDVRLEVPVGHDHLARSDTGGYDWCEHCGAISEYDVRNRAAECDRRESCPLRELYADDEFEEDDAERRRAHLRKIGRGLFGFYELELMDEAARASLARARKSNPEAQLDEEGELHAPWLGRWVYKASEAGFKKLDAQADDEAFSYMGERWKVVLRQDLGDSARLFVMAPAE